MPNIALFYEKTTRQLTKTFAQFAPKPCLAHTGYSTCLTDPWIEVEGQSKSLALKVLTADGCMFSELPLWPGSSAYLSPFLAW